MAGGKMHTPHPVMGFRGFARVRANPFLECQDNQRTRSCFFLQTSDLYEGTCCQEV